MLARLRRDGSVIQAVWGQAKDEPMAELSAAIAGRRAKTRQRFGWGGASTPPVVVRAPTRAAEDLRGTA